MTQTIIEIPNALGLNFSSKIENIISSLRFPWYYLDEITYVKTDELFEGSDGIPTFGFSHLLYDIETKYESDKLDFIFPVALLLSDLFGKEIVELLRIKTNLLLNIRNNKPNKSHIDYNIPHWTMLYYVNDSDGDTIFYDSKNGKETRRCSPQKGKAVLFDGLIYHSSSCPIQNNKRIILNINFRGSEHCQTEVNL